MLAYAKRYQMLLGTSTGNKALDACIARLNRLETTVTRPYFLEVLRLYNENKISLAQVTDIFLTTENYLFRRTICDLPTNALNKIFLMLHREIIRYDGTDDNYVEKLKYALLSKKERARFPDDEEFSAAFAERPVFLTNSKNKIYILERIENFGTSEGLDPHGICRRRTYQSLFTRRLHFPSSRERHEAAYCQNIPIAASEWAWFRKHQHSCRSTP